jgi:hypothetical protein
MSNEFKWKEEYHRQREICRQELAERLESRYSPEEKAKRIQASARIQGCVRGRFARDLLKQLKREKLYREKIEKQRFDREPNERLMLKDTKPSLFYTKFIP